MEGFYWEILVEKQHHFCSWKNIFTLDLNILLNSLHNILEAKVQYRRTYPWRIYYSLALGILNCPSSFNPVLSVNGVFSHFGWPINPVNGILYCLEQPINSVQRTQYNPTWAIPSIQSCVCNQGNIILLCKWNTFLPGATPSIQSYIHCNPTWEYFFNYLSTWAIPSIQFYVCNQRNTACHLANPIYSTVYQPQEYYLPPWLTPSIQCCINSLGRLPPMVFLWSFWISLLLKN